MPSSLKSNKTISINDLYALKLRAIWKGFFQEHPALWCLSAYFFFEYVRIQSQFPSIDILPWAQLFMILSIIAAAVDKTAGFVQHKMNGLFIIFAMIIVISSLQSKYPMESWDYRNVMLGWLIVYFLTTSIVNTEKRLILFLIAYFVFNLKMGQHGAMTWAERGFSFAGFGLVGAPGWFHNSGEYAIQMLVYGSLGLAFVLSLKPYASKTAFWIALACVGTGYITVLGASSRGAQIGLAAIAIMMALKHKSGLKGLIVIGVLATLLYQVIPEEQMQRFNEMGEDRSSMQRLVYWEIGMNLAKDYPIFGIGYHNWMAQVSSMYPEGVGPLEIVEVPHSIYIEAVSELGFVGLFWFLVMVIYAFYINAHTRKLTKKYKNRLLFNLTYGLDAGLVGFLVAGAFVTVLYYPFFWIQISMIVALNNIARNKFLKEPPIEESPDDKKENATIARTTA